MSSFPGEQGPGPSRRVPLGRLLIARGLLSEEQLIEGLLEQDRTGDRLGQVLIRLGFVDEPSVAMALATQHGGPLKTEYGFATGFDPGGGTEPAIEAPLSPDPETSQRLPSDLQIPDTPEATVNGSSDRTEFVVSPEDAAVASEGPAVAAEPDPSATEAEPVDADAADEAAPTPVETAPIETQRDAVFGDPQTLPAEHEAPPQADETIQEADRAQVQLDAAQMRIAGLERELMDARELLAEERSKTAELEAARARVVDLERELAATREQLDERRSQTAELEEEIASVRLAAETAISALRGVAEVPSLVGAD